MRRNQLWKLQDRQKERQKASPPPNASLKVKFAPLNDPDLQRALLGMEQEESFTLDDLAKAQGITPEKQRNAFAAALDSPDNPFRDMSDDDWDEWLKMMEEARHGK